MATPFNAGMPRARGGRALPPKPKVVKPRVIRTKVPDPNQVANDNAMSAFRTALAQLQQATPQVDANAIRAPYAASQQAAGQLGQGLQSALLQSGQAAQSQYTAGLGQAQQQAAQFGISAGAGAQPTLLQNTGTGFLANQTQADTSAAASATNAWQQLLERTAAAKVSDAQLQRSGLIQQGSAQLAGNIPAAIQNEKEFGFKQQAQRENMGLARSQLTAKQINDLQDYTLGSAKVQQSGQTAATKATLDAAKLKQKTGNDAAKLRVSQDKLALERRTKQATAQGLKGIAAATKALSGTTSSAGTKKAAKGWDVTVQVMDPDTGEPTGDSKVLRLPDKRRIPKGYKFVSAETHYSTVPTSAGSAGLTASQWDVQMRSLLAQNPGRGAEVKKFLGPRPKK